MNETSKTVNERLDDAIFQKYIKPTQRRRKPCVGVEFELPVVNLKHEPVDFGVVHALTNEFMGRFSFDALHRDDDGHVYAAQSSQNSDVLSYDCSYNTLELSFGAESDLHIINARFRQYYSFVQEFLADFDHTLTGMGINPHFDVNRNEPIASERYRMLFHHLSSYPKYGNAIPFHHNPNFGLFSCAAQVQLDVEEAMLPEVLNTFTKLEPVKALIFSNSLWGPRHEWLCGRDGFWKNSLHGLNRHNVDMYGVDFQSSEDIASYIKSMSLYCVEREGVYINFAPTKLEDYFAADSISGEYYRDGRYHTVRFAPHMEDLQYLRSFKFEDLTYRGTVEFRSVCTQPVREILSASAFHTGLLERLPELADRLKNDRALYHKGYNATELREMLNRRGWPSFLRKPEVTELVTDVLSIAASGLADRGLGEEHFLEPLYERAKTLSSPALAMAEGLERGLSPEDYIRDYAAL